MASSASASSVMGTSVRCAEVAYFGRRLVGLAEAEWRSRSAEEACAFAEERHALQRFSSKVSWADILVSFAVAALAVNV
jgi:hypothetical protein